MKRHVPTNAQVFRSSDAKFQVRSISHRNQRSNTDTHTLLDMKCMAGGYL